MKKTKGQIMEDIVIYAKGKEITPSLIRKYLIEELHLSKSSAYRFLNKSDNEYIVFNKKKYEKRDNIDYSNDEYEKLTKKVFGILQKMKKNSSHTITSQEIQTIADEVGTTARFLSCNILGLDTIIYDKLMKGEIKESKLSLGLGFKNSDLSEKVKQTKHQLIQSMLGKKFALEEINELAEKYKIPLQIMLKKVFCLTRKQIINLYREKRVIFSNSREFIDYEFNEPISTEDMKIILDTEQLEDIRRDFNIEQLEDSEFIVFQEEDKKDSIYEDNDFYNISADNQDDFIEQLNSKKEKLSFKKKYLIEKYDEMYLELLNSYKELNIKSNNGSRCTPNTNKIMETYIREIKEIISRNPKYYKFYPPKLNLEDFEKIAEDFNIDKSFLAYKMFGETHYERKKKNAKNPYYEISSQKLPVASNFYMLFQKEIDNGIKNIVKKTIRSNTMISPSISEDLCQILKMRVIIRGNEMLFYGRESQCKDEYLAKIFSYLKVVCDSQCKKLRMTNKSLNDKIKDDSESEIGDFIASYDIDGRRECYGDTVERVLRSATDTSDYQIMEDMIRCLQETESREDAIKKLAEEIGISEQSLKMKLDEVYERLY